MRPLTAAVGALMAVAATIGLPISAAYAAPGEAARVTFEQSRLAVAVGDKFTLDSTVSNPGQEETGPLIAHLNVVSLTSDVYVDPEDWSGERTVEVDSLEPGAEEQITWDVQAVNAGRFAIYVVLLPDNAGQPSVSPTVQLAVASRRTLTASGSLPIAVAVPLLLGTAAAIALFRVKRR